MLKNILKLEGAQKLNTAEQRQVNGGRAPLCCVDWNPLKRICNEWDSVCLGMRE